MQYYNFVMHIHKTLSVTALTKGRTKYFIQIIQIVDTYTSGSSTCTLCNVNVLVLYVYKTSTFTLHNVLLAIIIPLLYQPLHRKNKIDWSKLSVVDKKTQKQTNHCSKTLL